MTNMIISVGNTLALGHHVPYIMLHGLQVIWLVYSGKLVGVSFRGVVAKAENCVTDVQRIIAERGFRALHTGEVGGLVSTYTVPLHQLNAKGGVVGWGGVEVENETGISLFGTCEVKTASSSGSSAGLSGMAWGFQLRPGWLLACWRLGRSGQDLRFGGVTHPPRSPASS